MSFRNQPRGTLFSIALILAGAILFLDNLGILPIQNIGAYWPLAFVVCGTGMLVRRITPTSAIWSLALIAFGILLTLGNLGRIRASFGMAWPLLLIAFGATALVHRAWWAAKWPADGWGKHAWGHGRLGGWKWQDQAFATKREWKRWERERRRQQRRQSASNSGKGPHEAAVFFSLNRRFDGQEIDNGELEAVFGSIEADFTGATIPLSTPEGENATPVRHAVIEATAVFGSVEIRVPSNWRVVKEGAGVFGSFDDQTIPLRPEPGIEPPTLFLRGSAVFGTVTIEN